ncbi:MAG: tetratricopeptide repeat protein [Deltaproteobacteria bacterium]|nr:tetratricopeptide repeat protein [Deltaproteobacteria bacterium]
MASWFTDFATAREAELRTSRAAEARKALVDAFENLLAVVEATADPTRTARLLVALEAVFRRIGSDARALAYHERLAPHLAGLEPRLRVRVEVVHATHLAALGREADAERAYASAIATARRTGDAALVGYALYRAHVLVHYGPAALAALERRLREATSLLAEHGSTWDRAAADQALGLVLLHLGRGDESREALERAIAQMRRGRLSSLLGPALNNLGHLEGRAGDWEAAAACLREALGAARDDGDKRLECVVRRNLGECALRDGDYPAAHAWLESASAIAADVGVARIRGRRLLPRRDGAPRR